MFNRCAVAVLLIVISLIYSFKAWRHHARCEMGLALVYVALALVEYIRV